MKNHNDAIAILIAAYPAWKCPPETAALWVSEVRDIAPDALIASALDMIREDESAFPNLARWRKRALQIAGVALGIKTAAEAWEEVLGVRKRLWQWQSEKRRVEWKGVVVAPFAPGWSSQPVEDAARAVGWSDDWDEEKRSVLRAQFERYFAEAVERASLVRRDEGARERAQQLSPGPTVVRLQVRPS